MISSAVTQSEAETDGAQKEALDKFSKGISVYLR